MGCIGRSISAGVRLCASCPVTKDVSHRREIDGLRPFSLGGDSFDSRSSPCQTWETGQDRQRQARGRDAACSDFGRAKPRYTSAKNMRMRRIRIWSRLPTLQDLLFRAICCEVQPRDKRQLKRIHKAGIRNGTVENEKPRRRGAFFVVLIARAFKCRALITSFSYMR